MARDMGGAHGHPDHCEGKCGLCHCVKVKRNPKDITICGNSDCHKKIGGLKYRGTYHPKGRRAVVTT